MKTLVLIVLALLAHQAVVAAPLKATKVESDLGKYLGFYIYRFEANLGEDEVLVVRKVTNDRGKLFETEDAHVGSHVRVEYEVVLVDSGAFHPSLRDTYMLRYPGSKGFIEKMRLSQWGDGADGSIYFEFSNVGGNEVIRRISWIGSVEKYSDVLKRWPGLPKPQPRSWSGSSRIIETK